MSAPRVKFCWECGSKLRGNHYAIEVIDGWPRVLHKVCAEGLKSRPRNPAWGLPKYWEDSHEEID
jgi:hypothetical protein